jgi:hypothetical protein
MSGNGGDAVFRVFEAIKPAFIVLVLYFGPLKKLVHHEGHEVHEEIIKSWILFCLCVLHVLRGLISYSAAHSKCHLLALPICPCRIFEIGSILNSLNAELNALDYLSGDRY